MYTIITDSATDLPRSFIEEHNLHVIPTPVVIDNVDYLDGKTIFTEEFYKILDDTSRDIKTYHINPAMFEEAFLPYAQKGETVIYICFSTGIAGTFNAANIAKQNILEDYPDFDLTIVDSKCASLGFGLLVKLLLEYQAKGATKEQIIEAAEFYRGHIKHIVTVNTLAYLVKGGRLSKFKGTLAETLDMKPIITVDENGALEVLRTVRGRKKAMKTLIDYAKEHGVDMDTQTVGFVHAEDPESLDFLVSHATESLGITDTFISTMGCAIGAHTGRGCIAMVFLDCKDPYK